MVDSGGLDSWFYFNAKDAMIAVDLFDVARRNTAYIETTSTAGNSAKRARGGEENGEEGENLIEPNKNLTET